MKTNKDPVEIKNPPKVLVSVLKRSTRSDTATMDSSAKSKPPLLKKLPLNQLDPIQVNLGYPQRL